MADLSPTAHGAAPVEEVAHLALIVGRLLFQNGSDTAQVQTSVTRFAAAFGCEVHLLVTYEALLLTAVADGQFRTKVGSPVPSMNVNLAAVAAVNRLIGEVETGQRGLADVRAELEDVEHRRPCTDAGSSFSRWA